MIRKRSRVHTGFGDTGCVLRGAMLEALPSDSLTLYAEHLARWSDLYDPARWDRVDVQDGWFPHRLGKCAGEEYDVGMVLGRYVVGSYGTIWDGDSVVTIVDPKLRAAVLALFRSIGLIPLIGGPHYLDGDANNLNPRNIVSSNNVTLQRSFTEEDWCRWADMMQFGYTYQEVIQEECLHRVNIRAYVNPVLSERFGAERIVSSFYNRLYWDFDNKKIALSPRFGIGVLDERIRKIAKFPLSGIYEEDLFITACRQCTKH